MSSFCGGFDAVFGRLITACRRYERAGTAETERRHIVVDRLVGAWFHSVSLVPDADIATISDGAPKGSPCGKVFAILVGGILCQVSKRPPIL